MIALTKRGKSGVSLFFLMVIIMSFCACLSGPEIKTMNLSNHGEVYQLSEPSDAYTIPRNAILLEEREDGLFYEVGRIDGIGYDYDSTTGDYSYFYTVFADKYTIEKIPVAKGNSEYWSTRKHERIPPAEGRYDEGLGY